MRGVKKEGSQESKSENGVESKPEPQPRPTDSHQSTSADVTLNDTDMSEMRDEPRPSDPAIHQANLTLMPVHLNQQTTLDPMKLSQQVGDRTDLQCSFCSRQFYDKHGLKRHEMTHTGEKPFKCPVCEKGFSQAYDLKQHELIHSKETPFHCKHCDKGFKQKSNMIKHERIHTGEKLFCCKVCKKRFTFPGDLKRHESIHWDIKPFPCTLCDKTFRLSALLKSHLKFRHGIEGPDSQGLVQPGLAIPYSNNFCAFLLSFFLKT